MLYWHFNFPSYAQVKKLCTELFFPFYRQMLYNKQAIKQKKEDLYMNNPNMTQVWDTFLAKIVASPEQLGYTKWLQKAIPLQLTDSSLKICVANHFTKEWLESRYKTELEAVISTVCQKEMKLEITAGEGEPEPQQTLFPPDLPAVKQKPTSSFREEPFHTNLVSKYYFENFIIGNSNRFAHAAALAVAEAPAKVYNPLFLYSASGLGKTHLMHAIGNRIVSNNPQLKVLYISSETFTNELINSIQNNSMEAFRNKYRNIDVLLIDDIQFLRKKESTQEEFFHTFEALHRADKQIIISSDRKPSELDTLEERLTSRFGWGLIADIQPPDLETRMAILHSMAANDGHDFPKDVILLMASSITKNIRELEGAYTKVIAFAHFNKAPISVDLTKKALIDFNLDSAQKIISVDAIQQMVASKFKIKKDDFLAKKRTRNVAFPRQIAMYLCRELTDYSLPRIGDLFGGRDHTTVIHACEKISKDMADDPHLKTTIDEMANQLKK